MLPKRGPTFQPVDVDRPETWPAEARRVIDEYVAGSGRGHRECVKAEAALRAALAGHKVLGYHCTRLFPHEAEAIGTQGLRALNKGLVRDKIDVAIATGELAGDARVHAERENVYAIDNAYGREGQVCLVLGRGTFDDDPGAVIPLLAVWSGEAIRGGPNRPDVLTRCGTPTIVVAQLDLSGECWSSWPGLPEVFAATLQGGHARSDLHWRRDVSVDDIICMWQPGDPEYDRHPALRDATSHVEPPRRDRGRPDTRGLAVGAAANRHPSRAHQALVVVPEEAHEIGPDPSRPQKRRRPAFAGLPS